MVKEKEKGFLVVLFLIVLVLLIQKGPVDQSQAFVGIGTEVEVQTEEYNVYLKSYDDYWLKTGCKPSGCAGKNACSVTATVIGEELGCPIEECVCEGYYYCQSSYQDRCQYGAVCEYPDECSFRSGFWYGTCCDRRGDCQWISDYDCGTYGGPEYDNFDGCSWAVRVEDKNGTVVNRFDAFAFNGPDWEKDEYYTEKINYVNGTFSVKHISDSYGLVQNIGDGIDSCKSVVFEIKDSAKKYDVCLGNDGLDTVHCEDLGYESVVTETCLSGDTYTCPDGTILQREAPNCDFPACSASCVDGIQNQNEEGIDCGGPCPACPDAETCSDGIQNQDETDIDCGGVCQDCGVDPTCSDGILNQGEDAVDCGGPCTVCLCSIIGCQVGYVCENNQCVQDTQQDNIGNTDTTDSKFCDTLPEVCDLFTGEHKHYAIAFVAVIMLLLLTGGGKRK